MAEQVHADAPQYNLGCMYTNGNGVTQSYEKHKKAKRVQEDVQIKVREIEKKSKQKSRQNLLTLEKERIYSPTN